MCITLHLRILIHFLQRKIVKTELLKNPSKIMNFVSFLVHLRKLIPAHIFDPMFYEYSCC